MRSRRRGADLVALLTLLGLVLAGCGVPATSGPDAGPTPSAVDYPALGARLEAAISGGSLNLDTVAAVLVDVDGRTELAHYRNGMDPGDAVHAWSATKSVVSLLVGTAIEDGLIAGLDQTLPELLPAYARLITGDQRRVTLRQLMDMTAGYPEDGEAPFEPIADIFRAPDATAFVLRRGLDRPPGQTFAYSSSSSHLVTAALAGALARSDRPRSVLAYATERLFGPLGIDTAKPFSAPVELPTTDAYERGTFGWGTDRSGVHTGCCFLRLRPVDLVKLGRLVLDGGRWEGRQVVPEAWVAESTTPSALNPQYALMWWRWTTPTGQSAIVASGSLGQLIVVVPERRLVVTVSSVAHDELGQGPWDAWALVGSTILPAFA